MAVGPDARVTPAAGPSGHGPSAVSGYVVAALAVAAAAAVRLALAPALGGDAPLLLFTLAVLVAGWWGGLGPGLLATALSAGLGAYLFLEPAYSLPVTGPADRVRLALFVLIGGLASVLTGTLRRARREADARREQLQESEGRLRRVIDAMFAFVGELSPDGTLTEANLAPLKAAGVAREDVVGRKFWDCPWWSYDPAVSARLREAFGRAARGEVVRYDETIRTAGDGRMVIDLMLRPVVEGGRVVGVISFGVDVSARTRAEAALRQSEERFRTLAESAPSIAFRLDAGGAYGFANSRWDEYFGVSFAEAARRNWEGTIHPDDYPWVLARWADCVGRGEAFAAEYRLPRRDGAVRWHLARAVPLKDAAGRVTGWCGTITDIHEVKAAQEALHRSEGRLRLAQRAAAAGTFEWHIPDDVNVWSPELEALYGVPPGGFGGGYRAWAARVHPDDLPAAEAKVREALASGHFEAEWRVVRPDGAGRWVAARAEVARDAAGHPVRMIGINIDITARKEAEAALREGEERLRLFIEHAPAAIAMFDRGMSYLAASRRWLSDYRLAGDVVGRSHYDLFPEMPERWKEVHRRGLAGEALHSEGDLFERLDGTPQWVKWDVLPWRTAAGEVGGVLIASEDVTDRKRAEEALRENHRFISEVAGVVPGVIYVFDLGEGRNVYVNRQTGAVLGYGDDEVLALGEGFLARVLHPEDAGRFRRHTEGLSALPDGAVAEVEYRFRHRDGTWRWFLSRDVVYRRGPDGRVRQVLGQATDITARKQAEEALRARERELQALADNTPDVLTRFDRDLRHVFVNAAVERATGRRREEFLGKTNRELGMPPDLCDRWDATIRAVFDTARPQAVEFRFDGPDGPRYHDGRFVPEFGSDGRVEYALGVTRDRTAEHAAAEALREAEVRFQLALRRAPVILFNQDRDLRYTWVHNPLSPFDAGGAIGKTDADLLPAADARTLEEVKAAVVRTGRGARTEVVIRPAGAEQHFDLTAEPIRDGAGEVRGIACAAIDITDLKRAEAALREADRRKDEFLATLAHELRNPLAPIRTGVQVLKRSPGGPTAARTLDMMDRQLAQTVRLIDDLLDVSRISRGKVELVRRRVTLREVVSAAAETSQPLVEAHRHELSVRLPDEPVWLDADLTRLAQVVSNLLNNAAKYTPDGGRIVLAGRREGGDVVVSVADSGVGIPADMLGRVFEMFAQVNHTLDRAQGGVGIGLALVRRLVEMHGGTVTAESPGADRGSTFTVRLPAAAGPEPADSAPVGVAPAPAAPPAGVRRVLVVDDNADAAESLAELLRLTGHDARTAHDGPAALDAARAFAPEVVFCDLGMPGMDGCQVARHLRADPVTRAATLVALTGWGGESDRQRSADAGFDLHLTKPVELSAAQDVLGRLPPPRPAPEVGGGVDGRCHPAQQGRARSPPGAPRTPAATFCSPPVIGHRIAPTGSGRPSRRTCPPSPGGISPACRRPHELPSAPAAPRWTRSSAESRTSSGTSGRDQARLTVTRRLKTGRLLLRQGSGSTGGLRLRSCRSPAPRGAPSTGPSKRR